MHWDDDLKSAPQGRCHLFKKDKQMKNSISKIVAINGSHRSEKGFTEIVLRKFIEGTESAKVQHEVIYPSKNKIASCKDCGKCLFETPGDCIYDDDMKSIISKLDEADLLVFTSPVYFDSMTSNMKKLIERLRPTYGPHFEFRNGRTYHIKTNNKKQDAIIISTAGNPERESFISISRTFKRIIDNMGAQLIAEFNFPASHYIVTKPQIIARQLEAVAQAGKEYVLKGSISKDLQEMANSNYIEDPEIEVQEKNAMILEIQKKFMTAKGKTSK
jgi:multimeric flavodoxin WrbA